MKKLFLSLLLGLSITANAGFVTGKQLLEGLSGNPAEQRDAMMYVVGSFDAYEGTAHCAPEGTAAKLVADMTKAFMEINRDKLHLPADIILAKMFNLSWPCPKKPTV